MKKIELGYNSYNDRYEIANYSQDKFHPELHPVIFIEYLAYKNLEKEIEVLRKYGNKDCTAMADEELSRLLAES